LLKLSKGIDRKDLIKSDLEFVEKLVRLKAVKQKDGIYKVDSKYRFGVVDVARTGTGYLSEFGAKGAKDLVIEPFDLMGATKGDIVVAKRVFKKGGRPKAKVIQVLKKEFETFVAYTKVVDDQVLGFNIKTDLPVTLAASQKSLKALPEGTVFKIDNTTNIILEVLGVLSDPKVDEKISLALYDKKEFFSDKAELEAKSYGDSVDKSMYPDRVDLTHLPFCTIDPPTAKDFDDAIYFDKEESALYVAIADVSEYVTEDGAIDKEAKQRGFSIYFPHKSIPMLPRALSENICSLKPEVDRLAFVYKITVDEKNIRVIKEQMIEAVIHSKRRYTYDKIDMFLSGDFSQKDEVDDTILEYLLPLNKLLGKFRAKRVAKGCEFRSTDFSMRVDENQNLIDIKQEHETPSHSLIEDAMLLANKAAANALALDRGIFRVHDQPSLERIEEMMDDLAIIGVYAEVSENIYDTIKALQKSADEKGLREEVDKLIIKAQKQAIYSHENRGHFGLGFDEYTHFTSPIRRYSDLIVHRLLKAKKRGDKKLQEYLLKNIEIIATRVSELERESAKVAWDYADRKYARWAADHIGEIVSATVVDSDRTPIAKVDEGIAEGARIFLIDSDCELFEHVRIEILESFITTAKIVGTIREREVKEDV
jgi:ribonuclease R